MIWKIWLVSIFRETREAQIALGTIFYGRKPKNYKSFPDSRTTYTKMVSLTSSPSLLAVAVAALLGNAAHAVEFTAPNWVIPMNIGTPYPPMTVSAGDSLTFAWAFGTHDVWIYPSGTCDPTGGIQIGSIDDNPTTYVFTESEAGSTITFACDVGTHCQAGMLMDVTVAGTPAVEEVEEILPDVEEILDEIVVVDEPVVVEDPIVEEPVVEEDPVVDEVVPEEDPVVDEVVPEEEPAVEEPVVEEEEDSPITGNYAPCYVCGREEDQVTEPDFVLSLPNPANVPFEVDCATLYEDGLNGIIPEQSCGFIQNRAALPCGCTAEEVTCGVCGEGFIPSNLDAEIQVPAFGTFTCGDLEASGLGGGLTLPQCLATEAVNRATNVCGCVPEDGFPECLICEEGSVPLTPEFNISLTPFQTSSCGDLYDAGLDGELNPDLCPVARSQAALACNCAPADYTCDVCGGDVMLNPESNFTVPFSGALLNCGELDAAGVDGTIPPIDCDVLSPLVQTFCGCAPAGFTCNICGEDSGLVVSAGNATFIPGEAVTCEEEYMNGLAGGIGPARCDAITPFAQFRCGCEEGEVPVIEEEEEVVEEPVEEEPVPADETEDVMEDEIADVVEEEPTTDAEPVVDVTPPAPEEDETDIGLVSDSGAVTSLEGAGSQSKSGSPVVSSKVAMALSFLMASAVVVFV